MPDPIFLLEEEMVVEGVGNFLVTSIIEFPESENEFVFRLDIIGRQLNQIADGRQCKFAITFAATNPFEAGIDLIRAH